MRCAAVSPAFRYGELYTHHDSVIRDFFSFIDSASVHKYTPIQHGDVVFAASGETHEEIGKAAVFVADHEACAGGDTVIFRPNSGIEPLFVGYAVNTEDAGRFKARFGQGSSVIHIAGSHLQQLPVFLPAPAEQRRIARVLDTVDEAIRATEAVIAKLEQVKEGLLHDLLTCGIDDNGELRDPERHFGQFRDSPLGRIPREWAVTLAANELEVTAGITLGPHRRPNHNPQPYLRVANVYTERLDLSDVAYLDARESELVGRTLIPGDILIVEGHANPEEIGRAAMATADVEGFTFQNHLFRVRPNALHPGFAVRWLNGVSARKHWRRVSASSSGLYTINQEKLRAMWLAVPPAYEQSAIVVRVDSVDCRIETSTSELQKLRLLRSGLMDDLLTGRVRVATVGTAP